MSSDQTKKPPKISGTRAQLGIKPLSWQDKKPKPIFGSRLAPPVETSEDFERVLALPRREPLDLTSARAEAMVELVSNRYARENTNCKCAKIAPAQHAKIGCITRLLPIQAYTLYEMGIAQGLYADISVGAGKSLCDLLAIFALEVKKKALLLVPPGLVPQLITDYWLLAEHFRVPTLVVIGTHAMQNTITGEPALYVLPYSHLSLPDNPVWIKELRPEAIIADEHDRLSNLQGAAASRVFRYFMEFGDTKYAGWTGSPMNKSILEVWHLMALALREGSPLPLDFAAAEYWAKATDAGSLKADPGVLMEFCDPGEGVRQGLFRRMRDTRGVVYSGNLDVRIEATGQKVQVEVHEKDPPEIPDIINTALAMVRKGKRPDTLAGSPIDEELEDALTIAKCASEVATGVFNRWKFPPIKGVPQKRDLIDLWYKRRRDFKCELREKLLAREEHLDSPRLCENAAMRFHGQMPNQKHLPEWDSAYYLPWMEIANQVKHQPDPVRLDPYLAQDAADWAQDNLGIVWYDIVEWGKWVSELSGLPLHTGGPKAEAKIKAEKGDRSIIASVDSHARGRNGLQFLFDQNLLIPLASAKMTEQLLGRLHRRGTTSEVVTSYIYLHIPEFVKNFEEAMTRAEFITEMSDTIQKLKMGWGTGR